MKMKKREGSKKKKKKREKFFVYNAEKKSLVKFKQRKCQRMMVDKGNCGKKLLLKRKYPEHFTFDRTYKDTSI